MEMRVGDIYLVNFKMDNESKPSPRPCIIIENSPTKLIPLTSRSNKLNIRIGEECGLTMNSYIVPKIATIFNVALFLSKIGKCTIETLDKILKEYKTYDEIKKVEF